MNRLTKNILELLDTFEKDNDLAKACASYHETVAPLVDREFSEPLEVAHVELKEMLFVHPTFSRPIRDVRTSIQIIRDQLEDRGASSSS